MGLLSDIQIPAVDVPLPGKGEQTLTVRGLSVPDLCDLYELHSVVLEPLYTEFKTGKAKDLQSIAVHLVRSAPYVVAGIISIANDAPDELEKAKRLPTMVQVRAVTEILKLTCNSVAEVKKMLADVLEGLESTNEILTTTQGMLPSPVEGDPIP